MVWLGKVWFWGISNKTLKQSGCRYTMDDREFFDIHIESPAFCITDMCHYSVMLNVRGIQPSQEQMLEVRRIHGRVNPTPIFDRLSDIPFPLRSILYMETDDYSQLTMDDCVYKHFWGEAASADQKVQIVPNRMDMTNIGLRDGLMAVMSRIIMGGP